GLGTMAQFVPFQCSMNVWAAKPEMIDPTAQTSLLATAAIPAMPAVVAGLFAMVHLRPFQCMNWAVLPRRDSRKPPPAHTSVLEMAATPDKVPVTMAG